jgi:hypothetical protein
MGYELTAGVKLRRRSGIKQRADSHLLVVRCQFGPEAEALACALDSTHAREGEMWRKNQCIRVGEPLQSETAMLTTTNAS